MLLRLQIKGFKNLADVDVRFGPFTCIAGANGAGKSNLFDAIRFLSLLSHTPLMEAAKMIRNDNGDATDIRNLFYTHGNEVANHMEFVADILLPTFGTDERGNQIKASSTLLRYSLKLAYDKNRKIQPLILREESLVPLEPEDVDTVLSFPRSPEWTESIRWQKALPVRYLDGTAIPYEFITTDQDKVRMWFEYVDVMPPEGIAERMQATMLTAAHSALNPTAFLARKEMESWQLVFLDPVAMRKPDQFNSPAHVSSNGSHLAATLYDLASHYGDDDWIAGKSDAPDASALYARISNRLNELISEVQDVTVDIHEERQELQLVVTDRSGNKLTPRMLSDGTLRFLALTILLEDRQSSVLCIEEPENGVHPARIHALIRLLQDMAVDPMLPDDPRTNPLRQVIITTHSPLVVSYIRDNSLLVATTAYQGKKQGGGSHARFLWLPNTWRSKGGADRRQTIARSTLLMYLDPITASNNKETADAQRVIDRPDMRQMLDALAHAKEGDN